MQEQLHEASEAKEAAERQLHIAEAADALTAPTRRKLGGAGQLSWPPSTQNHPRGLLPTTTWLNGRGQRSTDTATPTVPALEGPSAAELDVELAALPQAPAGDVTSAPEVEAAHEKVRDRLATLQSLIDLQPTVTAAPERTPEQTGELRGSQMHWPSSSQRRRP